MVTKDDLKMLFDNGLMQFAPEPNGGSIACYIGRQNILGGNWFYFGGSEADECTASEYMDAVGFDQACEEAASCLNECIKRIDLDEYRYYEMVIEEVKHGKRS